LPKLMDSFFVLIVKRVLVPTMALLSKEEGGGIVLECQLKDYYPEKVTVQWLRDDQPLTDNNNKVLQNTGKADKSFTYISQISIGTQYEDKRYTCKATHETKEINEEYNLCKYDKQKVPVVVIRRPFQTSDQSGSALLECVVKDLSSDEVCIKFQANNDDISEFICTDCAPSENTWSLTTPFIIPTTHQKKENTFTCTVYRPFKQWKSKPTGDIFDDPTIELVVVPSVGQSSSEPQKLLCSGEGFDPKIKWTSKSIEKQSTALDVTMMENGRLKVYSEISVPQTEWNQEVTYTCQIVDGHNMKPTQNKSINICGVIAPSSQKAAVYLLGPSQNHVRSGAALYLTCLVVGQSVKHFSIQWKENGAVHKSNVFEQNPIDHANGTQSKKSILEVSNQQWNAYALFTLKSVFKPSIEVKRARLEEILKEKKVKFSCTVKAPHTTTVSWLANGARKVGTISKEQPNIIVNNLTLTINEWSNLKSFACIAKHPCFPEEKAEIPTDDKQKVPVVVIRRPFQKSDQSGSALLECVVKDLSSGEVCIKFQANNDDISEFICTDCAPSGNTWSLTTPFTIPTTHQKKENTFTCTVYRPFKQWKSKPTGNIFDDPTIELVVVPSVGQSSSEPQKLLCSGEGFDPKIKWTSKSIEKQSTALDVTMMENGRLKVYSEISVPQTEWNQEVTYTCQIVDGHNMKPTQNKSINICGVIAPSSQKAAVYLLGPSQNHVRSGAALYLTCLVVGQSVKHFSIQWKENGAVHKSNVFEQNPIDHANGTQSKKSILEVSNQQWNAYALFTCEVKHLCSIDTQQHSISKTRDPKQPIVSILRPSDSDLSGLQNTTLLCFITGFFPSDISVEWRLNETKLNESHFINSPVVAHTSGASVVHSAPSVELLQSASRLVCLVYGFSPSAINITWLLGTTEVSAHNETNPAKGPDGKFSIRSYLQLQLASWAPGEVYSCRITHATGTQLHNISKSAMFEEAIFMNENKPETITQDTVEEAWNMACAFLALFLLSLLYGCTVTLVKVKPE
ncbi:Ig heavy chain C region, membrane-bound form, partial [Anabarilius grahami]